MIGAQLCHPALHQPLTLLTSVTKQTNLACSVYQSPGCLLGPVNRFLSPRNGTEPRRDDIECRMLRFSLLAEACDDDKKGTSTSHRLGCRSSSR